MIRRPDRRHIFFHGQKPEAADQEKDRGQPDEDADISLCIFGLPTGISRNKKGVGNRPVWSAKRGPAESIDKKVVWAEWGSPLLERLFENTGYKQE